MRPQLACWEEGFIGRLREYAACACSPVGKVKRVSQPYAPGGALYWTTYNYDGLGRTLSVMAADGGSTGSYLYQGNETTVTDAAGKWKRFTRDGMENLSKVTEPDPAAGNVETNYSYNALNQLTQVAMTRGGATQWRTFEYNGVGGNLSRAVNPENGTVTYTYTAAGKLYTKIDAKGQKVQYSYDANQRVTQVSRFGGAGSNWSNHQTTAPNPVTTISSLGAVGRYVRVQLTNSDYLSLAEVRVISGGVNVAVGKTATQSSTYAGSPAAVAAVDGNTNGDWNYNSVTATNSQANAWWEVDLGAAYAISSIEIWNRTDCCMTRLSDYWVFVADYAMGANTPATLTNPVEDAAQRVTYYAAGDILL